MGNGSEGIERRGDGNEVTFCFGLPMTAGKTAFGQSSPAIPVLQRPEPLSMTTAGFDMVRWDAERVLSLTKCGVSGCTIARRWEYGAGGVEDYGEKVSSKWGGSGDCR